MVVLTEADDGKTVEVGRGEQLGIRLSENPTTGFRWEIDKNNPEILALSGDQNIQAADVGIGGGSQRVLSFEAKSEGIDHLELKLWREWEGERSVTRRYSVTVRVR